MDVSTGSIKRRRRVQIACAVAGCAAARTEHMHSYAHPISLSAISRMKSHVRPSDASSRLMAYCSLIP